MELESQWWKGQLAEDIYHALRYKELKLPAYKGQSPQLSLRRYFADLIAIVSNRFRLCPTARHLAVYLLDLFMDRYDVSVQQLHVAALSCLLLASKFEEREDRVPKLETLNCLGCMSSMNLVLTKQNLLNMELLLLETLQWNLYLPTPAHFIEYYLSIAVHETDLHDGWPLTSLEKTGLYMAKYADYFLEVSLQDHIFLNFAPSLVAASCVASSRIVLRLSPTWPPRLQRLTAYLWEHLSACVERLLMAHDGDVKEASKQKCQQQNPSVVSAVFHGPGPVSAVPQYLHGATLQYPQQNCQPLLSSAHGPSSYMSQTSLQAGTQPHGHLQHIPASLETKVSMPFNRGYQVNAHYKCSSPCFDR
ncbi:cyclin-J isoform X1 [Paramormyrops kingsleyae]|uniref:Cyclin-J n=2 Tax=Paramormyrops kingsleyae TaxID=1676925 RepID=A0A3B3T4B0_9TELE|nr:cyclin-J isoform X1 [Paramormyrops kingsleyae]